MALLTSSAIATTTLHYTHDTSQNDAIPKIALSVWGKYVGIKTVDLAVWGINGVTNWCLGHDMINPASKKTKLAQSVVGTLTVIVGQHKWQKLK